MIDAILEISFDSRDIALEETIAAHLYTTLSSGSSTEESGGTTTVSAYFDSPADRDLAAALFGAVENAECRAVDRPRIDWLEHYEQSLVPMEIGTRFVVAPDARLIRPGRRMSIIVPQEQAFGTGSHETTALCIEMLETLDIDGRRGLDIGSGSGILAIAMIRLGASRAVAFDNDPDAFGALRDNRIRNRIDESRMALFIGGVEALGAGVFDVLTMNIIPEVIIPLLGKVVRHMSNGAALILSGILVVKRDEVVRVASGHGLRIEDERAAGEWWCGRFGAVTNSALPLH